MLVAAAAGGGMGWGEWGLGGGGICLLSGVSRCRRGGEEGGFGGWEDVKRGRGGGWGRGWVGLGGRWYMPAEWGE